MLHKLTTLKQSSTGTTARLAKLQRIAKRCIKWVIVRKWLLMAIIAITATVAVVGQNVAPLPINLATDPLFSNSSGDKPTMTLALSVEYPTVGAQYRGSNDYSNSNEYLGYYDAESCYTYNDTPTETRPTNVPVGDYKRFDRTGAATVRKCNNAFSGNFLNWATSSSIDMLRLALSGGDRVVDTVGTSSTPSLTILQRAVLSNGNPVCMWNDNATFPSKQLSKDGGGTSSYWGAVPASMITQANGSDIFIANVANQIYFGTSKTGSCTSRGAYTLGLTSTSSAFGPITNPFSTGANGLADFGSPTTSCANQGSTCSFSGVKEVLYGATGTKKNPGGWITFPASNGVVCSDTFSGVMVNPTGDNLAKKCYIRDYTSTWTPPSGGASSDAFFYSRVQVCNVSSGVPAVLLDNRDYSLCTQYPNGFYKPTGSIQKYSDQLRLSAFGYLMDQTQSNSGGRYGGTLRAPMKFVGAKTFDESGVENTPATGNPNAEWDVTTGVFKTNPDGDTTQTVPISGVINYLNKFGRTGSIAGRYKIYDPVGEMYGEALRYLQGLQPTDIAVANITSAMYDGFPAFAAWTDPYGGTRTNSGDYSCLKTNIVVIGDVNTHESNRILTRTADVSNNLPNFNTWKNVVANFESNTTSAYIDGQGTSRTTGNPNIANSSVQTTASGPQVLTGQAYWAHTQDIRGTGWTAAPSKQRPGLRVKSFFFDVNENSSSNNTSYRQNQNQFFTASKYGGFESDSSNIGGNAYNSYGNPFKRQIGTNDNNVWQKPAEAGEASSYYLSSSGRATLTAFDTIFARAATAARSIAGIAAPSKNFDSSGSIAYQGAFDTSDWSGDVTAKALVVNTDNTLSVSPTILWSAATMLSNRASPATTRNIVVGRAGSNQNPAAISFTWADITADTNTTLKDNLNKSTPLATADTLGQDRTNYIRGDNSREGTTFRTRNKLLGDIINSGVVYAGTPTASLAGESGYASFYSTNAARTPAVYVGANDGMLHAFNAATGDELFGYIPSWMGPKLGAITLTNYVNNHQAYVDSSPTVAEARVGSAGTADDWATVMVAGTGAGGPGVFALDVTNPTTFSASKVMWEFTRADDSDMGYVVGRPQIVKMRTSAPGANATYRWFAAVASGVNNYMSDTSGAFTGATINTTGGQPALFLLALDKAPSSAWTSTGISPNYYKISVPLDTTLNATNPPGLINFRPVLGRLKEVTTIFMGDLHGKVWKLDFSARSTSDWNMDKLSSFKNVALKAYPLFTARSSSGAVQPISMAPVVVAGPLSGGIKTYYVAFGTGKYLEVSDKTSTAQNTVYALYDNATASADSSPAGSSAISGRGRLQAGTMSPSTQTITVPAFTPGRPATDATSTSRAGWYADFATSGERQISNATVFGDNIIFGSLVPASAGSTGSCAAGGGSGYSYVVNIDTGNGTFSTSTVGLLGESLVAEILPASTVIVESDSTGARIRTVVKQVVTQGSLGIGTNSSGTLTTQIKTGRLSWRQINNYQDLKNAP